MRFRKILTVTALTAAIGGGSAAAAVTAAASAVPATTAAAITGHATTHEYGVDDTTSVPTGKVDPTGNGPIWAYDNAVRHVSWSADPAGNNTWDVTVATEATYHAFANPVTGQPWKGHGPMAGYVDYVVQAPAGFTPLAAHLPKVSPNDLRSQGIVDELFGLPNGSPQLTQVSTGNNGQYNFLYVGIPGQPDGLYFQHS